jgi:tetratricopeptide (TPR) repeat protein
VCDKEEPMGFRARKSFTVFPGVRLTVSKTGIGASAGVGPARYSIHSSGRETVSARTGIPGITYVESAKRATSPEAEVRSASAKKPGWFAPRGEKALYKAVQAQDALAIHAVGEEHAEYRLLSDTLAGLMLIEDESTSESLLQRAFDNGGDPAAEEFAQKYLYVGLKLNIARGVSATLPIGRDAVGLTLAELRQERGDLDAAIDVVEQLEPSTYAAVSLADLYAAAGRFDDVIDLTNGVTNEDDASALLLTFRGMAFRQQGMHDAAHEVLKEALKARSRDMSIRHLALSERAANYLAQNKKAMARKDLERILAEDSDVDGVAERLEALGDR